MMIRVFTPTLVAAWMLASAVPASTAEPPAAEGSAVLTVVGNIEKTNRSSFDAFKDPFINHHERPFEKAAIKGSFADAVSANDQNAASTNRALAPIREGFLGIR